MAFCPSVNIVNYSKLLKQVVKRSDFDLAIGLIKECGAFFSGKEFTHDEMLESREIDQKTMQLMLEQLLLLQVIVRHRSLSERTSAVLEKGGNG